MMSAENAIHNLRKCIDPKELSVIYPALRQDPFVWTYVQDDRFLELLQKAPTQQMKFWKPCNIALLDIQNPLSNTPGDQELFIRYTQTAENENTGSEDLKASIDAVKTLSETGKLAYGLFTQNPGKDQLERSVSPLVFLFDSATAAERVAIMSVFACLFGLLNNPAKYFKELRHSTLSEAIDQLFVHSLLSNPLAIEEQVNAIKEYVNGSDIAEKIAITSLLRTNNRDVLVEKIAQWIIAEDIHGELTQVNIENITRALQIASLYEMAGESRKAFQILSQVSENVSKISTKVAFKKENISAHYAPRSKVYNGAESASDDRDAVNIEPEPVSPDIQDNSLSEFDQKKLVNSAPEIRLHYAANLEKDTQKARSVGIQVAEQLLSVSGKDDIKRSKEDAYFFEPVNILKNIQTLELEKELHRVEAKFLEKYPTDIFMIRWIRDDRFFQKDWLGAFECAQSLAALDPEDNENTIVLAKTLEKQNRCGEAFEELDQALKKDAQFDIEDLVFTAKMALKIGKGTEGLRIGEMILQRQPHNIEGLLLMGQISLGSKYFTESKKYFEEVLEQEPANDRALLGKLNVLRQSGEKAEWFSTLKSALEAFPNSASLNHLMGIALAESGSAVESQKFLKKAYHLEPDSQENCVGYANALIDSGMIEEASSIIEKGLEEWQHDADLRFLRGKILAMQGDFKNAVRDLEIAVAPDTVSDDRLMQFSNALVNKLDLDLCLDKNIQDRERIYKSQEQITRIAADSDDPHMKFLLAKLAFHAGDAVGALEQYKQIAQKVSNPGGDLNAMVHASIGQAALAIGQIDLALVSLREANELNDRNLFTKRTLAWAYAKADLAEDAFSEAVKALELYPENVENLVWYARFLKQIGKTDEALAVYDSALRKAPSDAELHVEKCKLESEHGQIEACKVTLHKLAEILEVSFELLNEACTVAYKLGDLDLVLRMLEKMEQLCSEKNVLLLIQKSIILSQKNEHAQALKTINQVLDLEDSEFWKNALAGILNENSGKLQSAIEYYKKALDSNTVDTIGSEVTGFLPDDWSEWMTSAATLTDHLYTLCLAAGDLQEAFIRILGIARTDPNDLDARLEAVKLAHALLKTDDLTWLLCQPIQESQIARVPDSQTNSELFACKAHWDLENGTIEEVQDDLSKIHSESLNAKLAMIRFSLRSTKTGTAYTVEDGHYEQLFGDPFSATTLMELGKPNEAIQAASAYKELHQDHPYASFNLARTIIMARENSLLKKIFSFSDRIGESEVMGVERWSEAAGSLEEINNTCDPVVLEKWKARLNLTNTGGGNPAVVGEGSIGSPEEAVAAAIASWRDEEYDRCINFCNLYPNYPMLAILHSLVLSKINAGESLVMADANALRYTDEPYAFIAKTMILERSADPVGAFSVIRSALQLRPLNLDWQLKAAQLAGMIDNREERSTALQAAYALEPRDRELGFEVVKDHLEQGRPQKAVELILQDPNFPKDHKEGQLLLAQAYAALGDHPSSMQHLDMAMANGNAIITDFLAAGKLALRMDELHKGFEYARKAALLDPKNADAIILMARLLDKRGGPQESLKLLDKVMEKGRPEYSIRKEHALTKARIDGLKGSFSALQKLTAEVEDDADVLEQLCQLQYTEGMMQEAKENALKAIKADPERSQAHYLLGRMYNKEGNLDKAIHHFSECARLDGKKADVYLQLSNVFGRRREYQQALHSLLKGIESNPDESRLHEAAAALYKEGKNYEQAEYMLRKAASLAPDDISIQRQLGAIVALNLVHAAQEVNITL